MANLDVKLAFDVTKPSVVSKILSLSGDHGHVVAALLEEMQDVQGSASFENCETEFRYSRCIRQGGVEPQYWGVAWPKKCLAFGGKYDIECMVRGMMWARNYWLFSDSKDQLVCMVKNIIAELLDMEPKPELLWWTSTHKNEDVTTPQVGCRGKTWDLPFMEVFDVLGYGFYRDGFCRDGKGTQGTEKTSRKGLGGWWRDRYMYRSKSVPMKTMWHRVVSHVFSTAKTAVSTCCGA